MVSREELKQYHKKLTLEGLAKAIIAGAFFGFAVIAGLSTFFLLPGVFTATKNWGVWVALGVGLATMVALAAVLFLKVYRPSFKQTAARLDRSGKGLDERVITMLELEGDDSFIAQKQRDDLEGIIRNLKPKDMEFRIPMIRLIALAIVGVFAVTMFGGTMAKALEPIPPAPPAPVAIDGAKKQFQLALGEKIALFVDDYIDENGALGVNYELDRSESAYISVSRFLSLKAYKEGEEAPEGMDSGVPYVLEVPQAEGRQGFIVGLISPGISYVTLNATQDGKVKASVKIAIFQKVTVSEEDKIIAEMIARLRRYIADYKLTADVELHPKTIELLEERGIGLTEFIAELYAVVDQLEADVKTVNDKSSKTAMVNEAAAEIRQLIVKRKDAIIAIMHEWLDGISDYVRQIDLTLESELVRDIVSQIFAKIAELRLDPTNPVLIQELIDLLELLVEEVEDPTNLEAAENALELANELADLANAVDQLDDLMAQIEDALENAAEELYPQDTLLPDDSGLATAPLPIPDPESSESVKVPPPGDITELVGDTYLDGETPYTDDAARAEWEKQFEDALKDPNLSDGERQQLQDQLDKLRQ